MRKILMKCRTEIHPTPPRLLYEVRWGGVVFSNSICNNLFFQMWLNWYIVTMRIKYKLYNIRQLIKNNRANYIILLSNVTSLLQNKKFLLQIYSLLDNTLTLIFFNCNKCNKKKRFGEKISFLFDQY